MYLLYWICKEDGFSSIDLHYLYKEEALDFLEFLFLLIKGYLGESGKTKKIVEIITGKGNHSKNNVAVLFPSVK